MRVNAFLADSAEVINNKIYALGAGWSAINVRSFPAVHRRVAVAVSIAVPYTETNTKHQLTLQLQSEDGKHLPLGARAGADGKPEPVTQMGGEFTLGRPPQLVDGDEQTACFAFAIDAMRFSEAGFLSWVISIDGEEVTRLPMRVQQAAQ